MIVLLILLLTCKYRDNLLLALAGEGLALSLKDSGPLRRNDCGVTALAS